MKNACTPYVKLARSERRDGGRGCDKIVKKALHFVSYDCALNVEVACTLGSRDKTTKTRVAEIRRVRRRFATSLYRRGSGSQALVL